MPRTSAEQSTRGRGEAGGKRKRSDARKVAEQQRKQRELEVATVAVRRFIHNRDAAPDVVIRDRDARDVVVENDEPVAADTPRFGLFDR